MKISLFITLILAIQSFFSQNLVPNPLFEDDSFKKTIHKPNNGNSKFVKDWYIVNGNPDFFNDENSTFFGYPIIKSIDRGGKIGIEMYNKKNKVEGIYTKLSSPLVKGKSYKITFSIAHCQYSDYVIKHFPFILSDKVITEADIQHNKDVTLQVIKLNKHITYEDKWVKVSGIYKAKGGEKYLSLVNTRFRFTEKKHTSRVLYKDASKTLNKQMDDVAYYFFDNIQLTPVDDSSNYCQNELYESPLDANSPEKRVIKLKKQGIIHPESPTEFKEFKDYKHHIFLFDISSSMASSISQSKMLFNQIMEKIPENDIITGITFESNSSYIFQRQNKSGELNRKVNNLNADGGTTLQTGLNLVNKSLRADEKAVFYLMTDVGYSSISMYMDEYLYLKLKLLDHNNMITKFKYPTFDEPKDSIEFSDIFNQKALYNLPGKIPSLRLFESKLNREIRDLMDDPNVNEEKSQLVFISDCEFGNPADTNGASVDHTIHSTNYVFLVDASSSMRNQKKYDLLKKSAIKFNEGLNPQDRVSLVSFANKTSLLLDRISAEENDKLKRELNKLSLNGMTNIDKGLTYIYKYYIDHTSDQNINLILFTDGLFTISSRVKKYIKTNESIRLQVFQFGNQKNQELEKLANKSNLTYTQVDHTNEEAKVEIESSKYTVQKSNNNIYSDKISWRTFFSKFKSSSSPKQQFDDIN